MPTKVSIEDNIYQIGFWDQQFNDPRISQAKSQEQKDKLYYDLYQDAELFLLDCGEYSFEDIHISFNENLDYEYMKDYATYNIKYKLNCPSGKLIASPIHKLHSSKSNLHANTIDVEKGWLELQVHTPNESGDYLQSGLTYEEQKYIDKKSEKSCYGCCLSFLLLILSGWFYSDNRITEALVSGGIFLVIMTIMFVQDKLDYRSKVINSKIQASDQERTLLITIKPLPEGSPAEGGKWDFGPY